MIHLHESQSHSTFSFLVFQYSTLSVKNVKVELEECVKNEWTSTGGSATLTYKQPPLAARCFKFVFGQAGYSVVKLIFSGDGDLVNEEDGASDEEESQTGGEEPHEHGLTEVCFDGCEGASCDACFSDLIDGENVYVCAERDELQCTISYCNDCGYKFM